MIRTRRLTIWLLWTASSILLNGDLSGQAIGVEDESLQPIEIAVGQLVAEAEISWRHKRNWPRSESDIAAEFEDALTDDDILDALSASLHKDVAMDGYIKWQLLSFNADIDAASAKRARKIASALPRLIPQPNPIDQLPRKKTRIKVASFLLRGEHPAFIPPLSPIFADRDLYHVKYQSTVVSSGSAVGGVGQTVERPLHIDMRDYVKITEVVDEGNTQLLRLRRIVQDANRPAILYRNAVVKRLPQHGGIQLGVMYQDMADRIHAGDPTHSEAARRFVQECISISRDRTVKSRLRKRLIAELQKLHRITVEVTRSVTTLEVNRFRVDINEVRLSDNNLNTAVDALKGKAK